MLISSSAPPPPHLLGHSLCTERLREECKKAPGVLPVIPDLHCQQLQDPRPGGAQGQVPPSPGPAQPGWGVAICHTDQAQGLALQD